MEKQAMNSNEEHPNDRDRNTSSEALADAIRLMAEAVTQIQKAVRLQEQEEKKRREEEKRIQGLQEDSQVMQKRIEEKMEAAIRAMNDKVDRVATKCRKSVASTKRDVIEAMRVMEDRLNKKMSFSPKKRSLLPSEVPSVAPTWDSLDNTATADAAQCVGGSKPTAQTSYGWETAGREPSNELPASNVPRLNPQSSASPSNCATTVRNLSSLLFSSDDPSMVSSFPAANGGSSSLPCNNICHPVPPSSAPSATSYSSPVRSQASKEKELYLAVSRGKSKRMEELLKEGVKPTFRGENKNSVLHIAARASRFKILKFLLTRRLNVNGRNSFGQTPLHVAARFNKGARCARLLVLFKADVNIRDNDGFTPLHYALSNGNEGMVDLLLKAGATPIENEQSYSSHLEKSVMNEKTSKMPDPAVPNPERQAFSPSPNATFSPPKLPMHQSPFSSPKPASCSSNNVASVMVNNDDIDSDDDVTIIQY